MIPVLIESIRVFPTVKLLEQRQGETLIWCVHTVSFHDYAKNGTDECYTMLNDLPFSGKARGTGGLSVGGLLKILESNDLSKLNI